MVRGRRISNRMVWYVALFDAPLNTLHSSNGGMNTEPITRLVTSMPANASSEIERGLDIKMIVPIDRDLIPVYRLLVYWNNSGLSNFASCSSASTKRGP